jgi:Family of unknown function (DUF5677)
VINGVIIFGIEVWKLVVVSWEKKVSDNTKTDELIEFITNYIYIAQKELKYRWENWDISFENYEIYQIIGALIARQVTLATQMGGAPTIWNSHISPILHRTMADTYITFAWILKDPIDRARKYISYGLGQNKLILEHRKAKHKEGDVDDQEINDSYEKWANMQRYTFMTDVDIGSWSGLSTRKMAEEADCIDFYNYVYITFSPATHSMWNHVGRFNVIPCRNPLHKYHLVPCNPDLPNDIFNFYLSAKYLEKTFNLFDKTFDQSIDFKSAYEYFCDFLSQKTENVEED